MPPSQFSSYFIFPSLPLCSSDVSLFFFTKGGGYTCWPLVISRAASRLGWNLEWAWGSPNTTCLRAPRPCLLPPSAPSTPFTCGSPSKRGQAPSPHRGDGSWGRAPSWLHNLLPLPPHLVPPSSLSSFPPSQPRTPRCSSMEISGSGLLTTGLLTPLPPRCSFCVSGKLGWLWVNLTTVLHLWASPHQG